MHPRSCLGHARDRGAIPWNARGAPVWLGALGGDPVLTGTPNGASGHIPGAAKVPQSSGAAGSAAGQHTDT